jgi:hypothetical protein
MKCLEKDRNRGYDAAAELARDIERYLRDEPVLACSPSRPASRMTKLLSAKSAARRAAQV